MSKNKIALVTGCTGQDGSYLCELLLEKGYQVHGIVRRSSSFNTGRIDHIFDKLHLHHGDLTEPYGISRILQEVHPDEVYNLAAQSHVKVSFEMPTYTAQIGAMGVLNLLEAIRTTDSSIRFYQASSSEMFGKCEFGVAQNESTPFHPRSPYAVSKVFAHQATVNYREAYGLHASCGILFNHESPRRGETFVTRKITKALARISTGKQEILQLGHLRTFRDWGFAPDYVKAMWMMLQQPVPDDYVIATGESHSVQEFVEDAFDELNLDWSRHVEFSAKYCRPSEVDYLRGDASKAADRLGWKPSVTFRQLISLMVRADLDAVL